jgi:hypothetical protein
VFEPGNDRHLALSSTIWQQFLEEFGAKDPSNKAFQDAFARGDHVRPIINPSTAPEYDCWCPGCRRNRKLGGRSVWVSNQGAHVATYGLCRPCMDWITSSQEEGELLSQRCEDNLLFRYPFLEALL